MGGVGGRLWRSLRDPERPQVALEVRASGVGVVRTRRDGRATVLAAASAVELPPEVLLPSLTQPNLADPARFRAACRSALERAGVLDGYEEVCRSLSLEPGLVELSGLALCRSAFAPGLAGDRLLVNWDEGYATLILVRDGWPLLARTLTGPAVSSPTEVAREAAQTLVYARERLGSPGLEQVVVRAAGLAGAEAAAVLEAPLGLVPTIVDPWRALGTADAGPAAQALAGAAACLGAPA